MPATTQLGGIFSRDFRGRFGATAAAVALAASTMLNAQPAAQLHGYADEMLDAIEGHLGEHVHHRGGRPAGCLGPPPTTTTRCEPELVVRASTGPAASPAPRQ